jgi:hypothetical protein
MAKKVGFIFVINVMLTLCRCLCFVLIGAFWVIYKTGKVFCVVGYHSCKYSVSLFFVFV